MTEALERVVAYFEEFRGSVNDCRQAGSFRPSDWKEAYGALGRLRDRYKHEKGGLTADQRAALEKVFENDPFIEGMMEFRQVGEHVIRRGGPLIRTTGNAPIQLTVESSAMAVFSAPVVVLRDIASALHTIDHLKMLEEAERRIGAALAAHERDVPALKMGRTTSSSDRRFSRLLNLALRWNDPLAGPTR